MKYFTEKELRAAAQEAVKNNFNSQIDLHELEQFLSSYPEYTRSLVKFSTAHNDSQVKCFVMLSGSKNVLLDVTFERHKRLPNVPQELLA